MARAGGALGPYPARHLQEMGRGWRSKGSGFPRNCPPDRIVYEFDPGRPLLDFMTGADWWIVSKAAVDVLTKFSAAEIDVVPAEVMQRYKGEDRPTAPRWQCDVIRFEDPVDEAASTIHWTSDGKRYDTNSKLVFKSDLPANLHLFRIWHEPSTIVCSAELRDALIAARLSGIVFKKIGGGR